MAKPEKSRPGLTRSDNLGGSRTPAFPLSQSRNAEHELLDWCAACYAHPLKFVLEGYPWPIAGELGPDIWQAEELIWLGEQVKARGFDGSTPVMPIRRAWSTGHGVGKSTLIAWIVDWIMSTRRNCRGTITANTEDQLKLKTWAAIREWTKRCLTAHWWTTNSEIMYRTGQRESWFCAPVSCSPENADAYQGQHAKTSTSFYLFDESRGIHDKIWEAAEGGLTDGEPMIIAGGQMTANSGMFHRVVFGDRRDRWNPRVLDARACKFSNKALIAQYLTDYGGEESDFVRVRVRGLPPRASELQFIDQARVSAAMARPDVTVFGDEPLVAGVDVSGGGSAWNVVRFRRGLDARSLPPIRIPGEQTRTDRSSFLAVLAGLLSERDPNRKLAAMFVDSAYGSPYVERLRAMGYSQVQEIVFGGASPNRHQANMRAYMWQQMKEGLATGTLPAQDRRLEQDLCGPGYHLNSRDELVIEAKEMMGKRGLASPDDADALCLTWAMPVAPARPPLDLGPTVKGRSWQAA